jgi:hypothetical protein
MELKNTFHSGKMNKDLDERLVPNGEYTNALNVRVANSADGDIGAAENEKGNTKLTGIPSADGLQCIGAVSDEKNEKIYWFVVDNNGKSAIYEYDNKNDITTTVLKDERTGSSQVLNFDADYKITGANVIYNKFDEKSLLLFTDNLNPPRMVNIERAKEYGVDNFEEDDINLYKKPPRAPLKVTPFNLPTEEENGVKERFFSFSYRYKYLDGEFSALSAFTAYQFYPGLFELDFATMENIGMVNQFNAYSIQYNTGDKRVTDIQICFKSPLSDVVFVADTINKKENSLLNNATRTYRFSNKQVYQSLPNDELNRIYDNVPLKALAQDIIEDRVVFGNYVTQYDVKETISSDSTIEMDYAVEMVTKSRAGEEQTHTKETNNEVLVLDFSGITLVKGHVVTINIDLTSDVVQSTPNYHGGAAQSVNSFLLEDNYADATALSNSSEFSEFLDVMTAAFTNAVVTTPKSGYTVNAYGTFVKNSATTTSIKINAPVLTHTADSLPNVTEKFEWAANTEWYYRTEANQLSLKSNRTFDYGIVYLDEYGRYSTVLPNSGDTGSDKSSIAVPAGSSQNINFGRITVKNKAPYWADRYKFFVKTNRDLYYNLYATVFYQEDNYRWVLLNGNNGHKVEEGDVLVVKSDQDGPLSSLVKCKVLEVTTKAGADVLDDTEGWLQGNENAGGQNVIEQVGRFMKIRPIGFRMDYSSDAFLVYADTKHLTRSEIIFTSADAYADVTLGDFGNPTVSGASTQGIMQFFTNNSWGHADSNLSLNAGSIVTLNFFSADSVDTNGDEMHSYKRSFIVQNNYTYDSANKISSFERWLDAETHWYKPSGQSYYQNPDQEFKLRFLVLTGSPDADRIVLNVETTEQTNLYFEQGYISAAITVQRQSGVVVFETEPKEIDSDIFYETEQVFDITNGFHQSNNQNQTSSADAIVDVTFGNTYSFGNGVESISVKDERFSSTLSLDYRPNLILTEGYKEIHNQHALIYSGAFNENSSYNSLNEFNSSRGNVKFMDLKYGSIQKVSARETDLLVLQEDQVSKVLFGKNIISSPSGSGSLTQIEQVLGQVVPYSGEYGIAKNPESFAEYGGNVYFTDAIRGSVLRLGANGISPISTQGMNGYFRDNLSNYVDKINLGGFDPKYKQYVLSMNSSDKPVETMLLKCSSQLSRRVAVGTPFIYNVDVGTRIGTFQFKTNVTLGAGTLKVVYNGTTTTHNLTSGTNNFNLSLTNSSLSADSEATVTITATQPLDVQLEHECPQVSNREVKIIVMNDINDAGKSIINRFRVGTSSSYYSQTDVFAANGIARNESIVGPEDNIFIPANADTVLLSSYRIFREHNAFFNSCSRFGFLVTSAVKTPAQVQSDSSTTFLTQTNTPANSVFQETTGSFTFSPSSIDDILYIIFDYQDGSCSPTDEAVSGVNDDAENNPG